MRGQNHLTALRERGLIPRKGVLVMVAADDPCHEADEQPHEEDGAMSLWIRPTEMRPDLWCVVGLKVVVWCPHEGDIEAVRRVCRQCVEAGALKVVGIESGSPPVCVFGEEHGAVPG